MRVEKPITVKVRLELSDGYEKRFTTACLEQLKRRKGAKIENKNIQSAVFSNS